MKITRTSIKTQRKKIPPWVLVPCGSCIHWKSAPGFPGIPGIPPTMGFWESPFSGLLRVPWVPLSGIALRDAEGFGVLGVPPPLTLCSGVPGVSGVPSLWGPHFGVSRCPPLQAHSFSAALSPGSPHSRLSGSPSPGPHFRVRDSQGSRPFRFPPLKAAPLPPPVPGERHVAPPSPTHPAAARGNSKNKTSQDPRRIRPKGVSSQLWTPARSEHRSARPVPKKRNRNRQRHFG